MSDPNDRRPFWRGKRVLITGHAGFVGSNLVAALLDLDALPCGVDRVLSSPSLRALGADCLSVVADVTDLDAMVRVLTDLRPDVVFQLAGMGHIADCQADPYQAFAVNAMGTVAVLEAVRRAAPTAAVVCASSNHAYIGGCDFAPYVTARIDEKAPLAAVDAYGASKVAADTAVRCYRASYGLRAAAVRHVNSYGPADPHRSHLVTGAILSCLEGKRPVLRSDGSAVKGYLHVADVVHAYLTVAQCVESLPGHAVNVADEACEASALDIAREVMRVAGMDGEPEVRSEDLSQRGYEERLSARVIRSIGWVPRFDLRTGIADAYAWYQKMGGMAWLAQ